ncbi:hypothetical protein QTP70_031229, partial [Hemibagrus guttatus]
MAVVVNPGLDRSDVLNDFCTWFEVQNNVVTSLLPTPRPSYHPHWTPCSLYIVLTAPWTMPSPRPSNWPSPNRTIRTHVQMLFIDFSSAFNTIIPQHLIEKLSLLGLNTSLCKWILDFLTGRPQSVRIRNSIFSTTTTLNTGAPQEHSSNHIIHFPDDTTMIRRSLESLFPLSHIYTTHCIHKANSILDDPSQTLFPLLPSGIRYYSIQASHPNCATVSSLKSSGSYSELNCTELTHTHRHRHTHNCVNCT